MVPSLLRYVYVDVETNGILISIQIFLKAPNLTFVTSNSTLHQVSESTKPCRPSRYHIPLFCQDKEVIEFGSQSQLCHP